MGWGFEIFEVGLRFLSWVLEFLSWVWIFESGFGFLSQGFGILDLGVGLGDFWVPGIFVGFWDIMKFGGFGLFFGIWGPEIIFWRVGGTF